MGENLGVLKSKFDDHGTGTEDNEGFKFDETGSEDLEEEDENYKKPEILKNLENLANKDDSDRGNTFQNQGSQKKLRRVKSSVIREQKVDYGLNKYPDPNEERVISTEKIKKVNGKIVKVIEVKRISRRTTIASNKLPIKDDVSNKSNLSIIIIFLKHKINKKKKFR